MASLTKYAGTISQTTGGNFRSFSDLNNLKNNVEGSWANSNGNIKGKSSSPNRPSTLSFTNFGFNLPTGAEVSKIVITYRHKKTGSLSIGAPTISLLGIGGFSSKAVAPKTSMETHTKSFYADGSKNNNLITPTTNKVDRSTVNSSSFGVKVDYPANTNSSEGTMSISYVRVTVEYKVPSYALTLKKVSGGYNEESYTVEASISNTNLTSYNPSCTLTAPTGFSFSEFGGSGEYTVVSPTTISWNPKFTSKVASSTASFKFDVDVTYPSGQTSYTGTFTLSESLYSSSKSLSATITDRPSGTGEESETDNSPMIDYDNDNPDGTLNFLDGEHIFYFKIPPTDTYGDIAWLNMYVVELDDIIPFEELRQIDIASHLVPAGTYSFKERDGWKDNVAAMYGNVFKPPLFSEPSFVECRFNTEGIFGLYVETVNIHPTTYYWMEIVNPPDESDLSTPFFTVLEPSEEEYNRLGSGYTYIAQADIKHTTTDDYSRDWYKNNRIGVFNNRLKPLFEDNGTTTSHNDNWSNSQYMTRTDTGTTISNTSGSTVFVAARKGNTNLGFENKDMIVEFEIVENPSSTNRFRFDGTSVCTGETYAQQDISLSEDETGRFKFVYDKANNTILKYKDDEYVSSYNHQFCGNMGFLFRLENGASIKFRNFVVYPVIDNLSPQQIYENAEYWSEQTAGLNEYNSVECEFTYNSDYPLYILMTGDYPEAEDYGYDMGTIKYDTPCIIEKPVYNGRERNGTYPVPIEALLDGEDIATLQLAKDQTSQAVVLYDFPVDETISTNDKLAIRGLQVRANIEATDNLVVQAKLHSPTGEIGSRSILIDSNDEEIVIGGLGDLWGFTTLQMTHLELWQLELSIANILSQSDSSILFNNVEIIFYLETVEKQEITIKVEDEDIAYYGAFIETVKIPEGLNTDTSFLSIDGTDTNDAYRQNIREKTITIEFNLSNCELQTSTDMLRQLTKLFVNEKDQYNRPIPKRIQFSHYPNDYFEYIMEEPFDVNTEITDYTIKAQLTVPSGTSYSLYDTVTNTTGNANGLAAVNPIITVRPSDVNIQVTESNTGQVFNIAYTGDWNDHTVEIDCEDRKVYLIKGEDERIDISKYADYNSDWFRLDGEYEFSSVNCTILSVIFNERW